MAGRGSQSPTPNAALERLHILVGEWDVVFSAMSFLDDPAATAHGRSSFEWLEGGAFLIQHSEPPRPEFPRATAIIGPDDEAGTYCMLYFDSRGVSRIYQMSLSGGVWKLWRDFPGFSQRFVGTFSSDGHTVTAKWEKSTDGAQWMHDFDITYRRISP